MIDMETSRDTLEIVRQCFKSALDLQESEALAIHSKTAISDFKKWDSFGHLKLMLELEKRFGIELDEDKIVRLTSVATIIQAVEAESS